MIQTEYNVLNGCKYIKNKRQCQHDSNVGYEVLFSSEQDGWDSASGMSIHYIEGSFLWCFIENQNSYVGRSSSLINTFEADYFGEFEIDMRLDYDATITSLLDSPKGRIQWKMTADSSWESDAYEDFDITPDGAWHRYRVNLLINRYWVGDCEDFRVFPCIEASEGYEVCIKRMAFRSEQNYKCKQPACGGHDLYKHPCPHIGTASRAFSNTRKTSVALDSSNCRMGVSIDGYTTQYFDIDLNHAHDCLSVAQAITIKLNSINIGGYRFAECIYDEIEQNFSIYSGTIGAGGSVNIFHGLYNDVTEELGFYDSDQNPTWKQEIGKDPVDGYVEAYKRLPANILYRLPSSNSILIDYNPVNPAVSMGRSDLRKLSTEQVLEEGNVMGSLMIDVFGAADYYGEINTLWFNGQLSGFGSKIFLLRPSSNQALTIIKIQDLSEENFSKGLYRLSVNWEVVPGDVLAIYQCLPALHKEIAVAKNKLYKYSWLDKNVLHSTEGDVINYTKNDMRFYGYAGLPVYGFSNRKDPGVGIESELRYEYGISKVAVLGDEKQGYAEVNLTELDTTEVKIVTTTKDGMYFPTETKQNYYVEFNAADQEFWIDFKFPKKMKSIYRIRTAHELPKNIRAFAWEHYLDPVVHPFFTWSPFLDIQTKALSTGSSRGWMRFEDPVIVILDEEEDWVDSNYLGFNYVTDVPDDYFPGLTESEQKIRLRDSRKAEWKVLDQYYGVTPYSTEGIRLHCWKASDARINDIDIFSLLMDDESLVHAVDAYGLSGPLVFDTEKYEVTNIKGERYSSSSISRVQTEDYVYDLEFETYASGVITAPVGTTLSRLDFNLSKFPAKVSQIKLIPQHLAVRVHGDGDEPLEEINNLNWGMPSDGSEWKYGLPKKYKVCNDMGTEARLKLGVADPLDVNQSCVFSSSLGSQTVLDDPPIGNKIVLINSEDYVYSNSKAINYRSIMYSVQPVKPEVWYSSTNSGVVWQTIQSGSPFDSTRLWSEPENPYHSEWKVYNWAKSTDISIDGSLNISLETVFDGLEPEEWLVTTYCQEVYKNQPILLETRVEPMSYRYTNVDIFSGLVMFDVDDPSKGIRIDRYTGNGITTSGYLDKSVPHGDYICCGRLKDYRERTFVSNDISSNQSKLMLRLSKDQTRVQVDYKLPWESWTTVSSFSISDWSNNLRIGVFVRSVDLVGDALAFPVSASFDYLAYRKSSNKITDLFDYQHDFEDFEYTYGDWVAHNPEKSERLETSPSGIYMINHLGNELYTYFDHEVNTPALSTEWGSIMDKGTVRFNLKDYNELMLASGNHSAGVLLQDSNDTDNYIQYSLTNLNELSVIDSESGPLSLTISGTTSASGIWMRLHKTSGVYVPSYSYDGIEFTEVSGYSLRGWSMDYPVSIVFSSDLPSIRFNKLQLGTSDLGANSMAVGFNTAFPLQNVWGRQTAWDNLRYSASGSLFSLTSEKPEAITHMAFDKDRQYQIDRNLVKFIPDISTAYKEGYGCVLLEVSNAAEQLYDRSGKLQVEVSNMGSEGRWPHAGSSIKGLPQYDYPILVADLGRVYSLGRCPKAQESVKAKFSMTNNPYVLKAEWEGNMYESVGFNRKCLLSSSNQCTVNSDCGKPRMISSLNGLDYLEYFAGECDGRSTVTGPVYKSCPLYSAGQARWIMMEYTDYVSTVASGGSIWNFAPIELQPCFKPLPVTDHDGWWVVDYGALFWIFQDNDYALIYQYPGLNIKGNVYFNSKGSDLWRLESDRSWTFEDKFSVDLKFWQPENINSVLIRVGRDPKCFYEFTVTGTLTSDWNTHEWFFKDAHRVIGDNIALYEPFYTQYHDEYYEYIDYPYMPLPFINNGYMEVSVSGHGASDVYIKNFKNKRTRFSDKGLFLGKDECLYISSLDIVNAGTISLDYYPSEAAVNIQEGDPRTFLQTVFTLSSEEAALSVMLHPVYGWTIYAHTGLEKLKGGFLPLYKQALQMLPSYRNTDPFNIVFTWSSEGVPGRTDNLVLWVNGLEACSLVSDTIATYFHKNKQVKLTLGNGNFTFDLHELSYERAAYAYFSNLKVFKYPVSNPRVNIESEARIPENLLELSLDGSNWHSYSNNNLPLVSNNVQHGECIEFYLRNKKPCRDIKELHRRFTANLLVVWEVMQ